VKRLAWLVVAFSPAACSPQAQMSESDRAGPAIASFSVVAQGPGGQWVRLAPAGPVRAGEQVMFLIAVTRPVYVHVVQMADDGRAAVLFPAEDDAEPMRPGEPHRIAAVQGAAFDPVGAPGTMRVGVIASEHRLGASDPRLAGALRTVRKTGRWPAGVRPPASRRRTPSPGSDPSLSGERLPPDPDTGTGVANAATRSGDDDSASSSADVSAEWFEFVQAP
jgi:hypothetical protein